ncbi:MAG TPA: lysophospholipid acyltransferase family protein [Gemmatimonadaceae bacterium]|jgi:1-acyl-sn-glycerol-3-phosphate acyltransferase
MTLLRTIRFFVVGTIATLIIGTLVIVSALIGVKNKVGGILDWSLAAWSRWSLAGAGSKVRTHGLERINPREPHIFMSNHLSWLDIPVLGAVIPQSRFVAKIELFSIPLFGRAMRAVDMVPMDRQNRKAAFSAYDDAAKIIRGGTSIIVFPEGTRGLDYRIRSFKKGPFVLAIAAGVPIVPVLLHGSLDAMPTGSYKPLGTPIDVHFLDPVASAGLTYDDRDRLAADIRARMSAAMESLYGVVTIEDRRIAEPAISE